MGSSPIRLVILTSRAPWGMGEAFVLTEAVELQRRVAALLVIPVRPGSILFHENAASRIAENAVRLPVVDGTILAGATAVFLRSPGRVVRILGEIIRGSGKARVLLRNLAVFPKAVYVAGLVRRFRAHHIHAHWASAPATMALIASRLSGVPWSFTAHRWDIAEDNLLKAKVQSARFARAISFGGRDEILRIIGEPDWPTLVTVHMGIAVPEQHGEPRVERQREFSIGCIANLVEKKGHRYLIEACRILTERGHRFVCHFIGGGPLRRHLEALVRDVGLEGSVRFRGPVPHDDVLRLLRGRELDLMVLPSVETTAGEREGIPVALMEALAHRIPAISTDTGEISELLGDGAGVLVRPADAVALADAIDRLMVDPVYREFLAQSGFARVSADFNLDSVADRLASLMDSSGMGGISGREAAPNTATAHRGGGGDRA